MSRFSNFFPPCSNTKSKLDLQFIWISSERKFGAIVSWVLKDTEGVTNRGVAQNQMQILADSVEEERHQGVTVIRDPGRLRQVTDA